MQCVGILPEIFYGRRFKVNPRSGIPLQGIPDFKYIPVCLVLTNRTIRINSTFRILKRKNERSNKMIIIMNVYIY